MSGKLQFLGGFGHSAAAARHDKLKFEGLFLRKSVPLKGCRSFRQRDNASSNSLIQCPVVSESLDNPRVGCPSNRSFGKSRSACRLNRQTCLSYSARLIP